MEDIELSSLVGEYELSGVDIINLKVWKYRCEKTVEAVLFVLNDKAYIAVEGPCDGHRNGMEYCRQLETPDFVKNKFAPVTVLARHLTDGEYLGEADILQLLDRKNGGVILEIGTKHIDDYYPSWVCGYYPESMSVNQGVEHGWPKCFAGGVL